MSMPAYFAQVPSITLCDPLARLLGAGDGVVTYTYEDAVKLAGHSCPTVAGAWLMLRAGLARLWKRGLPERGAIQVYWPEAADAGTTGVVAAVASLVTGARGEDGFKGIGRLHSRRDLLFFDAPCPGAIGMQRTDDGTRIAVNFDPSGVSADERMRPLLQQLVEGLASDAALALFGELWQDRVRRILVEHADSPDVVRLVEWR